MVESEQVPGKGRIRTSIEKIVSTNSEKGSNECEYRKIVESRRVPGKCRIRASIEKGSNEGKYREKVESVRVSKKLS